MALNTIRITSAASFNRKLKTLELALHHEGMHPRYQLYFVREGKTVYTLSGKPIVIETMRRVMDIPKDAVVVKIGHLVIKAFGKVKAVYAFARPSDAFGLKYHGSTTEYYNELLEFAHIRSMAPGFQYSNFWINLVAQQFVVPKVGGLDEWRNHPWYLLNYRASDILLTMKVYRPTPEGMPNGEIGVTYFKMHSAAKSATNPKGGKKCLMPITLTLSACVDNGEIFRHMSLRPSPPVMSPSQMENWSIGDRSFTFGLRLPINKL